MGSGLDHLAAIGVLIVALLTLPNTKDLSERFQSAWPWLALSACAAAASLFLLKRGSEFLYFQF